MIQTLATRDYAPGTFDGFGTVIYDEAHHMSARVFSRCCEKLPGRHVIGLTATPNRSDGLDRCLPWLLGPVAYRARRETKEDVPAEARPRAVQVTFGAGRQKEMICRWGPRRGQIEYARMVTALTKETKRTDVVVGLCELFASDPAGPRHLLVLSERVAHLDVIRKKLVKNNVFGDSVAIVKGGSKESEREHAFRQRVILSSYQYASEGLDVKILDTLIMASPPPGAKLEQVVGRVLRPCAEKQRPYIVDVVDPFSVFETTARKRVRLYAAQGFVRSEDWTADDLRRELAAAAAVTAAGQES
jgi:superfamily II DNA or RNA helicase